MEWICHIIMAPTEPLACFYLLEKVNKYVNGGTISGFFYQSKLLNPTLESATNRLSNTHSSCFGLFRVSHYLLTD